jgi:hypothetical protein
VDAGTARLQQIQIKQICGRAHDFDKHELSREGDDVIKPTDSSASPRNNGLSADIVRVVSIWERATDKGWWYLCILNLKITVMFNDYDNFSSCVASW